MAMQKVREAAGKAQEAAKAAAQKVKPEDKRKAEEQAKQAAKNMGPQAKR